LNHCRYEHEFFAPDAAIIYLDDRLTGILRDYHNIYDVTGNAKILAKAYITVTAFQWPLKHHSIWVALFMPDYDRVIGSCRVDTILYRISK